MPLTEKISGLLSDATAQTYFERGSYLSSSLSFSLSILGAKKNFSQEKIPPAMALLNCSVIQSFQVSKLSPLLTPL